MGISPPSIEQALFGILRSVDNPSGNNPDFTVYLDYADSSSREIPSGLVSYMYQESPSLAVATLSNHHTGQTGARSLVLQAVEDIETDLTVLLRGTVVAAASRRDSILNQLDVLSRHPEWYVRLYVAHTLRQEPELRNVQIVERLRADSSALVRMASEFDERP
jgi:hypothetical protein